MREKQGTIAARTSAREFFQSVFGAVPELPDPDVPVPDVNDAVKLAQLLGAIAYARLRLCPAASGCQESLVRVNIGLDVRPGL